MDLIIANGGLPLYAIEIKISNSSVLTKGNYYAYDAVNAKKNFVITSGSEVFKYQKNMTACSLWNFLNHEF